MGSEQPSHGESLHSGVHGGVAPTMLQASGEGLEGEEAEARVQTAGRPQWAEGLPQMPPAPHWPCRATPPLAPRQPSV